MSKGSGTHYFAADDERMASVSVRAPLKTNKRLTFIICGLSSVCLEAHWPNLCSTVFSVVENRQK